MWVVDTSVTFSSSIVFSLLRTRPIAFVRVCTRVRARAPVCARDCACTPAHVRTHIRPRPRAPARAHAHTRTRTRTHARTRTLLFSLPHVFLLSLSLPLSLTSSLALLLGYGIGEAVRWGQHGAAVLSTLSVPPGSTSSPRAQRALPLLRQMRARACC